MKKWKCKMAIIQKVQNIYRQRNTAKLKKELNERIYAPLRCVAYKIEEEKAKNLLIEMNLIFRKYKPHYHIDSDYTSDSYFYFFNLMKVQKNLIHKNYPYILHELEEVIHFSDILQANVYYGIMKILNSID